jgi:hypothetical protein
MHAVLRQQVCYKAARPMLCHITAGNLATLRAALPVCLINWQLAIDEAVSSESAHAAVLRAGLLHCHALKAA